MIRQFIKRIFSPRVPQVVDYQPEFKRIEKALDLWVKEKRYRRCDQSHDEIARELNTSNKILNSYFSKVLKQDFRTWRTELRVVDAKILLLERKELSIQLISEMVGFSDRSNFHRQFTKIVGCSPKQWRESSGKSSR
jgi:AraC-like DNA-binding protein